MLRRGDQGMINFAIPPQPPPTNLHKANDNNYNNNNNKKNNTSTHNVATTTHHRCRGIMSSRQRRSNVAATPRVCGKFRNTVVNIIISNNCFNLNAAPDNLTKLCHNAATTMSDCAGSSLPQSWFNTRCLINVMKPSS